MNKKTDHLLLIGPPGSNKIQYAREQARKFCGLSRETARARSYICRVAGLPMTPVDKAPFRAPHHTASGQALRGMVIDGYIWRPGEFQIAHGGTLLLDELPEFRRDVLDTLREALTTGEIAYRGEHHAFRVPAKFRLIATMNLCPCGRLGCSSRNPQKCTCSDASIKRYAARVPDWLRGMCRVMGPAEYGDLEISDVARASVDHG